VTRPALHVVLDTTAVAAYARGSDHVGEVLRELVDEGAGFGLLALCLYEAADRVKEDRWPLLDLLAAHPYCTALPLPVDDWRPVAAAAQLLGDLGRATAALPVARDQALYVLTSEPDAYGGLPTIGI
jgi:hypothetical protein